MNGARLYLSVLYLQQTELVSVRIIRIPRSLDLCRRVKQNL